jgi:hypothetical protein
VKPTAMLQDALIDLSDRGEIVLEPFAGSGSTLIACQQAGRVCHCIELDPLYVDVILKRYNRAAGQAPTLEEGWSAARSGQAQASEFDEQFWPSIGVQLSAPSVKSVLRFLSRYRPIRDRIAECATVRIPSAPPGTARQRCRRHREADSSRSPAGAMAGKARRR